MIRPRALLLVALCIAGLSPQARAEPWIAVKEGMKCNACHVNTSGGGMRNAYGNIYAQMQLAANRLAAADVEPWTGHLSERIAVGGNLRFDALLSDVPNQETQQLFDLNEARMYLLFSPVPGRVEVYLDQHVAPGSSVNREAYARFWTSDRDWYLKAGQMYLPYGLRLEDDSAFIRAVPGINFTTPDTGVEIGWESALWTAQFAVSNGTAGGPELDNGKQASARLEHVRSRWRAGASINVNDTDDGTRSMQNIFAGVRTGSVAWLAEVDFIRDDSLPTGARSQQAALLEANWNLRAGHNLKITGELLDPDRDAAEDEQHRYSIFWEYFPFEFAQVRLGARMYDGNAQIDIQNRTVVILQVHGYF